MNEEDNASPFYTFDAKEALKSMESDPNYVLGFGYVPPNAKLIFAGTVKEKKELDSTIDNLIKDSNDNIFK